MTRPLNRWEPVLPVTAMQTYSISQPLSTHWRKATCKEVNCEHMEKGWRTTVQTNSDDEALLVRAIRAWKLNAIITHENGFTTYTFTPGQECLKRNAHRVQIGRESVHVQRDGDWRGNPGQQQTMRAEDWLDSFMNSTDKVQTLKERG